MRRPSSKTIRTVAALLWLLIGSYQLWQVRHAPIGDFANYYYASQALAENALPEAQLYEPYLFNRWVDERAPSPVFVNYAPVPPLSVLAYLPFAKIPNVYRAKLYFNIVGLLFFVGVFWWGSEVGLGRSGDGSMVEGSMVEGSMVEGSMVEGSMVDSRRSVVEGSMVDSRRSVVEGSMVDGRRSMVEGRPSVVEGGQKKTEEDKGEEGSMVEGSMVDSRRSTVEGGQKKTEEDKGEEGSMVEESMVDGRRTMVEGWQSILYGPWWIVRSFGLIDKLWKACIGQLKSTRSKNLDQLESNPSNDGVARDPVNSNEQGENPSTIDHGPTNQPTPPSTIDHRPTNQPTRTDPLPSLPLLLSPFILWTPLYNNLYQGQSYLYIVAFLWLGFLLWRKQRWVGAALVWAVPISLKIFPAIILLFLLVKRYKYTFGWTIAFALFFSALPMVWVDYPTIVEYYQEILPRLFAGEINDPYTILYQSARVFFDQLFVLDGHLNAEPLLQAPALASFLYLVFQWIILGLLVQLVLKRQLSDLLAFGLVILAGLLVSGYGSNYSMLLLFFPAVAIVAHAPTKARFWGVGLLLLFIAGNLPIYRLQDAPFILQFPRMYALIVFLAWVYYWERPASKVWVWVGLGLLLLVKWVLPGSSKAQLANYYLPDGSYPIIFDYESTEEGLLLYHYRGQGAEEDLYTTSDKIYTDDQLKIINDQVFYGDQQLSQSRSRKKKPLRLNETEVIYLSDEGRGVGFYTLRKLNLP